MNQKISGHLIFVFSFKKRERKKVSYNKQKKFLYEKKKKLIINLAYSLVRIPKN